jgi:hypothetical protein
VTGNVFKATTIEVIPNTLGKPVAHASADVVSCRSLGLRLLDVLVVNANGFLLED